LYPEYSDRLIGNFCSSLEPYTKVWELLPFREVQIVHINVELKTEREFSRWYGVSVEDIMTFERNKQAVVMVNLPREAKELPDYLDPILEKRFPTSRRVVDHMDTLVPTDADSNSIRKEIVELFTANSKLAVDTMDSDPDRIRRTTEAVVAHLLAINEIKQLKQILELLRANEVARARKQLEFSRLYLIGPPVYSLSGFHTVSWNAISNRETPSQSLFGKVELFSPAGATLARKLHLYRSPSLDDALDKRHDYGKARKALSEFERHIRKHQQTNPKPREEAAELEEVGKRFSELVKGYERRKKIVDAIFVGGGIASFVAGAVPPLIVLGGAGALDEVIGITCGRKPIRKSLVELVEPRGLRSFFDAYERTKIRS
jgi:hypothetical protein